MNHVLKLGKQVIGHRRNCDEKSSRNPREELIFYFGFALQVCGGHLGGDIQWEVQFGRGIIWELSTCTWQLKTQEHNGIAHGEWTR